MPQIESRLAQAAMQGLASNTLPLPSVPDVALAVGRLCRDSSVTAADIAREVARDPAISVRLLRVANCAAQRSGSSATSVQQAIARLGLDTVRQLVYAMSLQQVFTSESRHLATRLRENWTTSVSVAALAHLLADRVPSLSPEIAMLAGLIHRIGALPIVTLADRLGPFTPAEVDAAVSELQGSVGQAVLYAWGFPPSLTAVPLDCTNFERAHRGPADCTDVVSVAVLLADERGGRYYRGLDRKKIPAIQALGLDPAVKLLEDPAFQKQLDERLGWLEDA